MNPPQDLPLHSTWTLYWHKSFDNDWSPESYKKIISIDSIITFWRVFNNLPRYNNHFWFLMRGDHPPMWEDPVNRGQGFIYKVPLKDKVPNEIRIPAVDAEYKPVGYQPAGFCNYVDLILSVIGEMITDDSERIIGVSISPKKGECQIRLWDTRPETPLVFGHDFKNPVILSTEPLVNPHPPEETSSAVQLR